MLAFIQRSQVCVIFPATEHHRPVNLRMVYCLITWGKIYVSVLTTCPESLHDSTLIRRSNDFITGFIVVMIMFDVYGRTVFEEAEQKLRKMGPTAEEVVGGVR